MQVEPVPHHLRPDSQGPLEQIDVRSSHVDLDDLWQHRLAFASAIRSVMKSSVNRLDARKMPGESRVTKAVDAPTTHPAQHASVNQAPLGSKERAMVLDVTAGSRTDIHRAIVSLTTPPVMPIVIT